MLVEEIMTRDVVTVTPEQTISVVARLMGERKIGMVVVVGTTLSKSIVGVLSDSDIIKKVVGNNKDPSRTVVQEIMTAGTISIKMESTVSDAANIMRSYRLKRLPVVKDGLLVGIISSTDIINSMAEVKKILLDMALHF